MNAMNPMSAVSEQFSHWATEHQGMLVRNSDKAPPGTAGIWVKVKVNTIPDQVLLAFPADYIPPGQPLESVLIVASLMQFARAAWVHVSVVGFERAA